MGPPALAALGESLGVMVMVMVVAMVVVLVMGVVGLSSSARRHVFRLGREGFERPVAAALEYELDHPFTEGALMGSISIVQMGITCAETDAIVNAANEGLRAGGGVCGAIFEGAGHRDMQAACDAIGHCATGSAVITPGFALKARYVIHAVGPVWEGGDRGEAELLTSCYSKAIELAVENGCGSIAFPLISSGIFGYPMKEAWRVAIGSCLAKLDELGGRAPEATFCVLSQASLELGEATLQELLGDPLAGPFTV